MQIDILVWIYVKIKINFTFVLLVGISFLIFCSYIIRPHLKKIHNMDHY